MQTNNNLQVSTNIYIVCQEYQGRKSLTAFALFTNPR